MLRIAVLVFLMMPFGAAAAVVPVPSVKVTIGISPSYPKPGEAVTFTAYASVPQGTYTYRWSINGKEAGAGIDLTSIAATAGNSGSETAATVSLVDQNGKVSGRAEYVIRSGDVDILWEGVTVIPSFYRGKPLVNAESDIRLEAIPHLIEGGRVVAARDLIYTWSVNGSLVPAISGYGKASATIRASKFAQITDITVVAKTQSGSVAGQGVARIPHLTPILLVYEDRPLAGLWSNRAVRPARAFQGEEMAFRAVPFFFSSPASLTYVWSTNNEAFPSIEGDPSSVILRRSGNNAGTATVGVTATKLGTLFEFAARSFELTFENI